MRPWTIALLSVVAAVLAAGGLALPWVEATPTSALAAAAVAHAPTLLIAALAAYGVASLLLATEVWETELRRLRRRLGGLAATSPPPPRDVAQICAETQLGRLAAWLRLETADPPPETGPPEAVMPEALRGEVVRLHHIWLARSQFYTALAVLAALAAFGTAQDYRPVFGLSSAVPTVWAVLGLVGLVLLALLARLVVDASVEPVIEAARRLAAARRAAELSKPTRRPPTALETALAPGFKELAQRLVAAVDSRRDAGLGAAAKLAAATEAATAGLRSTVEGLEAALTAAVERLPRQLTEPAPGFAELEAAIERLIAALAQFERLRSMVGETAAEPRRAAIDENLARELARLLRDIDAEA
jgi:hypothetical protein